MKKPDMDCPYTLLWATAYKCQVGTSTHNTYILNKKSAHTRAHTHGRINKN